ncbi:MAG: hypothetical protein NTU61_06545 [Candidatus Altiarchaeota archaeon]|nr:hypothetical protein [Candidatus Altiarchaeota archaeon]
MADDFGIRKDEVYVKVKLKNGYINVGGGFLRRNGYGSFLSMKIRESIPAGSELIIAETKSGGGVVLKQPS